MTALYKSQTETIDKHIETFITSIEIETKSEYELFYALKHVITKINKIKTKVERDALLKAIEHGDEYKLKLR